MKRLDGKVALVTGAESGIGQAIAIEFAQQGANVIITYFNNPTAAAETILQVEQAGAKGLTIQVDVSGESSFDSLFETALQHFPQIDILVNCAGVRSTDKYIHEVSVAEFMATINTNLLGTFMCCRKFVQHRLANGGNGRVINISSIHEEVVSPGKTDYCASKAGIKALTRALAMEVADKQITVNNIAPGMILTPMNKRAFEEPDYRKELEQRIPAKTSGLPADVAKVAFFLASADAAYITGTTQVVDGGLMLSRAQGAK